jgi:hypothetical protein
METDRQIDRYNEAKSHFLYVNGLEKDTFLLPGRH